MPRMVQTELLDSLSPQHPDSLHSRRDLRLTNGILGNHRWFQRMLPPRLHPGDRTLEIGAGTGELTRRLGRHGIAIDALDRWPQPDDWPASCAWHRTDLRTFSGYNPYRAVLGNLIFHHLEDRELAALGVVLQDSARVILACEPLRRRRSQLLFRLVGALLGANHVTLHDGHVSIAAGFVGDELPRLLGLGGRAWEIRCVSTLLGAYRMIAVRRT